MFKIFYMLLIVMPSYNANTDMFVSKSKDSSVLDSLFDSKKIIRFNNNPLLNLNLKEKFNIKNNFENYMIEFLNKSIIQSQNSLKINKHCEKNLREFLNSLLSFEPWSLAGNYSI